MTLPTININGTYPSDLLHQQTELLHSIRAVLDKLSLAAPHGRDYIGHISNIGFDAAREEHFARVAKMRETMLEVEAVWLHCNDAVIAKEMAVKLRLSKCVER